MTEIEVACLMRVLSKPELDDSVRYDELEMLLHSFGVSKYATKGMTPTFNNSRVSLSDDFESAFNI